NTAAELIAQGFSSQSRGRDGKRKWRIIALSTGGTRCNQWATDLAARLRIDFNYARRQRSRIVVVGAITTQSSRALWKHSRRELVRRELSESVRRWNSGRELASRHDDRP